MIISEINGKNIIMDNFYGNVSQLAEEAVSKIVNVWVRIPSLLLRAGIPIGRGGRLRIC